MEVSGIGYRRHLCLSGAGVWPDVDTVSRKFSPSAVAFGRKLLGKKLSSGSFQANEVCLKPIGFSKFSDEAHIQYYGAPRCGGKKEKKEAKAIKKKLKLVKGLSKDLSAFSGMGFGVEDRADLIGEIKEKMISEAAEVLLAQLQQIRAEEKEMKMKRKTEKAALKASMMKSTMTGSDTSSSSSDSECKNEVVDMTRLRNGSFAGPKTNQLLLTEPVAEQTQAIEKVASIPFSNPSTTQEVLQKMDRMMNSCEKECSSTSSVKVVENRAIEGSPGEKIEVCMGGKCKKSGAEELLVEFEKMVGIEGAVVGCKCMGKCREGPNVRVMSSSKKELEEGSLKPVASNPFCMGVLLEDVGVIVSNFLGERKDVSLLTA